MTRRTRALPFALGVLGLSLTPRAQAHFSILTPPPASTSTDGGKGPPPCGPAADSNVVTPVRGGSMLTIRVNESVFHPGFYRVALALNSPAELPADNVVKDKMGNVVAPDSNGLSDTAVYEATPVFPVLADHLWAHDSEQAQFETQLQVPNVTCEKCTLQVIEFMSNHNANVGGGFFYHHCANLQITADPSLPVFVPPASASLGSDASSVAPSTSRERGSGSTLRALVELEVHALALSVFPVGSSLLRGWPTRYPQPAPSCSARDVRRVADGRLSKHVACRASNCCEVRKLRTTIGAHVLPERISGRVRAGATTRTDKQLGSHFCGPA
jgi:hypothetical protein